MKNVAAVRPFISIIVPVYNAASTIEDCISALLSLQYPENRREIIIVDNKSSDNTADIIKQFPVIYLKEVAVQSSYAARNKGVQHAQGEILAFTDSDCIPDTEWLLKGVESFNTDSVGAVAGKIVGAKPKTIVEEFLQSSGFLSEGVCLSHPFLPFIQTANAFYWRGVFDEIGAFNQKMISGGDADFSWRMQLNTEYTLKHNEDAVVIHKHRATPRKFYKQMYTHGIGKADLEKIYSQEMSKKGLRLDCGRSIMYVGLRIFVSFVYHMLKSVVFLLTFQGRPAVFEMFNWYGKVGKRVGGRSRMKQLEKNGNP